MTRTFRVPLAGPLDVRSSSAGLGRWGDDLLDRWDGERLLRVLPVDGGGVPVRATVAGTIDEPALDVAVIDGAAARDAVVADSLRRMFMSGADVERALDELAARDPVVAEVRARYPGIRPLLHRDPLVAMIRAITAQQVNLRWAAVGRQRIAEAFGTRHDLNGEVVYSLEPGRLAGAVVTELRALQLTTTKSVSVIACARAVADGLLAVEELERLEDEEVISRLVVLPGIGRWSAEWFLARTLGRPRVVGGDLGVRKAVGRAYLDGRMPGEVETRSVTAHWGAAAGVAQQLLLHDLVAGP